MHKLLILAALLPLGLLAGNQGIAETTSACTDEGGQTVQALAIPARDAQARAQTLYVYASASTDSGMYREANGWPGLQPTDHYLVCGANRILMSAADDTILEYAPKVAR